MPLACISDPPSLPASCFIQFLFSSQSLQIRRDCLFPSLFLSLCFSASQSPPPPYPPLYILLVWYECVFDCVWLILNLDAWPRKLFVKHISSHVYMAMNFCSCCGFRFWHWLTVGMGKQNHINPSLHEINFINLHSFCTMCCSFWKRHEIKINKINEQNWNASASE